MGLYRLSLQKALIAFVIDIVGYTIFGPYIIAREIFFRKSFSPSSILLLRLDHMGDVLMATPAIIALKKQFPSARITVGVKEVNRCLISLPGIVTTTVPPVRWKMWVSLRKEKFDLVIDFKGDLRNIILLFLTGSKERVSYGIRGGGFLLTKRVKYISGIRHEIDRNLDIVKAIAGEAERQVPRYDVSAEKEAKGEKVIGIHPGANSSSKRWPASYFARLANRIEKEGLGRVIVFVGPNEERVINEMKQNLDPRILIRDDLPLEALAVEFKKLDLFIGNDSGPFHLAEAVGTKVITIFGATYPEIVGPVSSNSVIIKTKRSCAPCRMPGQKERCKSFDCLKEISVDEVYEVVKRNL